MNRRSLLSLSALALAFVGFLPFASAQKTPPKSNGLHADLVGPRSSGGAVDVVLGPSRTLRAKVWQLPAGEARLVLGGASYPLVMDRQTNTGALVIDGSLGLRFPTVGEGTVVAITVRGQVVMKGELAAPR
jgi:hypothetical protein